MWGKHTVRNIKNVCTTPATVFSNSEPQETDQIQRLMLLFNGVQGYSSVWHGVCLREREEIHQRLCVLLPNVEKGGRERVTKAKRSRQPRNLRVGNPRLRSLSPRVGK